MFLSFFLSFQISLEIKKQQQQNNLDLEYLGEGPESLYRLNATYHEPFCLAM